MKNILFLCLGNNKIIGDSLGPLVGSFIEQNKDNILKRRDIEVIGTIEKPIGYKEINNIQNNIDFKSYKNICIIDSALGNERNIGRLIINTSSLLYAGSGVNIGIEVLRRYYNKRNCWKKS